MPKVINCPYFKYDEEKFIRCENAKRLFDYAADKHEHINHYCASLDNWGKCDWAMRLNIKYEECM